LHAYITYCKAVENNNEELRQQVLKVIGGGHRDTGSFVTEGELESPFEEEVVSCLADFIEPSRIKLQYKLG
jgi:nanoRNase/pAp phosphatase (c-di-AMP/oligoRNAs hydrolase)